MIRIRSPRHNVTISNMAGGYSARLVDLTNLPKGGIMIDHIWTLMKALEAGKLQVENILNTEEVKTKEEKACECPHAVGLHTCQEEKEDPWKHHREKEDRWKHHK